MSRNKYLVQSSIWTKLHKFQPLIIIPEDLIISKNSEKFTKFCWQPLYGTLKLLFCQPTFHIWLLSCQIPDNWTLKQRKLGENAFPNWEEDTLYLYVTCLISSYHHAVLTLLLILVWRSAIFLLTFCQSLPQKTSGYFIKFFKL